MPSPPSASSRPNAVLLRRGSYASVEELLGLMEDFNMPARVIGTTATEHAEIKRRLGWAGCIDACKFYDADGTDTWYYYGYRNSASDRVNQTVIYKNMRSIDDDVVIVREGPTDSHFEAELDKPALARAIFQFRAGDPDALFAARERSRFLRKEGIDPRLAQFFPPVITIASTGGNGGAPRFFIG